MHKSIELQRLLTFEFLSLNSEQKLGFLLRKLYPQVETSLLEQVFGLESGTIDDDLPQSESVAVEGSLGEHMFGMETSMIRSDFTLGMGGDFGDEKSIQ